MNSLHGHSKRSGNTPTYRSWQMMKDRCTNPNNVSFSYYGGRGISYDQHWNTFINFLLDMGERDLGQSLDRINNNLGYSKDNCRWTDHATQQSNKRTYKNNHLGIKGVRKWRHYYQARGSREGVTSLLYMGPDLEEAIEARKVWERLNVK